MKINFKREAAISPRKARAHMIAVLRLHEFQYEYDIHNSILVCPKCGSRHNVEKEGVFPCVNCNFDWIKNRVVSCEEACRLYEEANL